MCIVIIEGGTKWWVGGIKVTNLKNFIRDGSTLVHRQEKMYTEHGEIYTSTRQTQFSRGSQRGAHLSFRWVISGWDACIQLMFPDVHDMDSVAHYAREWLPWSGIHVCIWRRLSVCAWPSVYELSSIRVSSGPLNSNGCLHASQVLWIPSRSPNLIQITLIPTYFLKF